MSPSPQLFPRSLYVDGDFAPGLYEKYEEQANEWAQKDPTWTAKLLNMFSECRSPDYYEGALSAFEHVLVAFQNEILDTEALPVQKLKIKMDVIAQLTYAIILIRARRKSALEEVR